LIYSTGISWISPSSVSKSQLPWSTWPWWGNFYPIREKSYKTRIYQDKNLRTISYHDIT
jgi:hypothetical protein